ncbi:acyltransferase domain-containing protein [Niabella hibiscisoli]|nr:acyltransferase domain-containing protein [Niabella hibiscisoli]MCH5720440.1 acyltransferase domain-containing protein [Niabella hibiscisoli]
MTDIETDLGDIAYTINTTRQDLPLRNFVVAKTKEDLIAQLAQPELIVSASHSVKEKNNSIVFLFPGQGNQYPNMGRDLYDCEEVYRNAVDECADILETIMNEDIRDIIFVDNADEVTAEKLKDTRYAQPAIFTTSYALAKLYMSWGINPAAFAGHSIGEFVGAHLSGVFSLKDALHIVAERGRLMSELPAGSMLSVRASEERVKALLETGVFIAAQNATELCVVSGETGVIHAFAEKLTAQGIVNKLLRTSHAFHSAMMDPMVPLLKAVVESTTMHVPQIPIMSTVTAGWLKDGEATSAAYWSDHARETVRFGQALKNIQQDLNPIFLEAGPGTSATIFVSQNGLGSNAFSSLSTATLLTGEAIAARGVLGKLWQRGVEINWKKIYNNRGYNIAQNLPTYAYNKKRFWIDPPEQLVVTQPVFAVQPNTHETMSNTSTTTMSRKDILLDKLKEVIESASGLSVAEANPNSNFTELGLDSLLLTQLTSSLKKEFSLPVTFRQLSENYDSLNKLAAFYDANLPASAFSNPVTQPVPVATVVNPVSSLPAYTNNLPQAGGDMLSIMSLQLQLLTQQVAMMQQGVAGGNVAAASNYSQAMVRNTSNGNVNGNHTTAAVTTEETEELTAEEKVELKKPFGATARIEKK